MTEERRRSGESAAVEAVFGPSGLPRNVKVRGDDHDAKTLSQLKDVASRAEWAALMADGHVGYTMPVGGVAAYEDRVSIAGVGVDIACGNCAIRTDLWVEDLDRREEIADEIFHALSFGPGGVNPARDAPTDHPLFEDGRWDLLPDKVRDTIRTTARAQLGSVGGGNHYVDVFADETGAVWVGVHFGSRGFGHKVSTGFSCLAAGEPWAKSPPRHRTDHTGEGLVHVRNPIGHDYWNLMELAGRYAYAGREWAARKVVDILGGTEMEMVHNHHNFAWREEHFGRELVVVRKGATPAAPGQKGFVGGSMADDAVILRGASPEEGSAEDWQARQVLRSTVHGAGRVMSRRQAKREIGEPDVWGMLGDRGITLRGAGLDEAPQAYRRLDDVLAAQGPTVEILHRLRPLIVCMAPDSTLDPEDR